MRSGYLPVILLLGAKSTHNPLPSIPAELSAIKALLDLHKQAAPAFVPEYEPYFTQEHLKTKLDQLAGQVAVLHFAGHSDAEALVTDGAVVYAQHIAAILGTWRNPPSLIFLNGCHNAGQVKLFHDAGVPVVIATRRAVDDGQAAGFAREFYASLFAEGGQVGVKAAFGRAGSKLLLGENRQARSLDIGGLAQADAEGWDWGLFARQPEQESWTLRQLLTHERPRYDANGVLVNPYQGLKAFREEDHAWFFGRDTLTAELCDRIPATPLFTLLGASGSGKSSLVSAGVIPSLRDTGAWLIFSVRPGFAELAEAFARELFPGSVADRLSEQKKLAHKLQTHDIALPELLVSVRDAAGKPQALLCIDQFEELFTHAADQASVQAFQAQLIALVTAALPGCCLLLVMRADFLAAALANPAFADLLDQHASKFLGAMGQAELRAAIVEPARRQQVSIDPDLTAALLDAVEHQPGSLPLLQYVLSLLWEQRRDHRIVLEDYNRLGGLEKALETRANAIFDSFSASEQEQAKGVFLRLIQPGEGTEDTRRRAQLGEFSDNPEAQRVIKQLADERLITTQQADNREAAFAEVSHEALIRHWGRLREWLEASRETLRTQHQVSAGARAWEENQRDSSWLLTGSRLAVAEDWLEKYADRANVLEQEYIRAGVVERDRQAEEQEQQRQRELALQEEKRVLAEQKAEEQRKLLQKTRRLSWVMAMITLVMIVAAGFAWHFSNKSQVMKKQAIESAEHAKQKEQEAKSNLSNAFEEKALFFIDRARKSSSVDDFRKAFLYALSAQGMSSSTLKASTLFQFSLVNYKMLSLERLHVPKLYPVSKLDEFAEPISELKFSPSGNIIATLSMGDKSMIHLWDSSDGNILLVIKDFTSAEPKISFDPGGKIMAVGDDSKVKFFDVNTGNLLYFIDGHHRSVSSLDYSPDGRFLVVGYSDAFIQLWEVASNSLIKNIKAHSGSVLGVSYNSKGDVFATASTDKTIKLWGAVNGELMKTLNGHGDSIVSLEFSPVENMLASGSDDETMKIWNIDNGKVVNVISNKIGSANVLSYSPDGKEIVFGEFDSSGGFKIWNIANKEVRKVVRGSSESVNALAYSPDGKVIATGSDGGIVRLWRSDSGQPLYPINAHFKAVNVVKYSPDGLYFSSGGEDGKFYIRKVSDGVVVAALEEESEITAIAYSSDGKYVTAASHDGHIRVWDLKNGKELKRVELTVKPVLSLVYEPGSNIFVSSSGKEICFWNMESVALVETVPISSSLLAYSPDGKVIAASSGNEVILIDADKRKILHRLSGHSGRVTTFAYNKAGSILASGASDRKVKLWDLSKGTELKTLEGYSENITALDFNFSDNLIAVSDRSNELRIWDVSTGDLVGFYTGLGDSISTLAYRPHGNMLAVGFYNGSLEIWDSFDGRVINVFDGHSKSISALASNKKSKFVAVGYLDGSVIIWDIILGKVIRVLSGHSEPISSLLFSDDNKVVISGSFDGSIKLWDVNMGKVIQEFMGHSGAVSSLIYDSFGQIIISGSRDNKMFIWKALNGKKLLALTIFQGRCLQWILTQLKRLL